MLDNQDKLEVEQDESLDVRQLWNVIDRRKWLIGGFALGVSLLAGVIVTLMTPTYRATATVLIESQQANVVSIEEVYGLDVRNQQYFETQFAIIGSRPIAESVVDRLGLETRPEVPTLKHDAGTIGTFLHTIRTGIRNVFSSGDEADGVPSVDSRQETVEGYQERLEIEPVDKTQLVLIHFDSPDRDLATEAANAHAQAYIDSILDARLDVTQSASSWMARRVDDLKQKLSGSEARLQAYREQENLIDAEGIQSLPTKEINELSSRLVEARRRLSEARIAYSQVQSGVRSQEPGSLDGVPAVSRDLAVRAFREAEAEAERKVAELAKRYGPLHPNMQAAQSELQQATDNLIRQQTSVADSIAADFRAAQSDVSQLESELDAAKVTFQQVGRKQSRLTELQQEVDVDRQLYEVFYNRMQETVQTGDLESVNARIVSPAVVPILPASPNKRLVVALVFIASLVVGVIASLLDDSFNNTLRSSHDIEDKLGQPLLGMLPLLGDDKTGGRSVQAILSDPDAGEFREAVQTVRTGLVLTNLDRPCKVVMISSSVSAEGKSTVALNLACAFGQMEKTLLIDCDLRRPSIGEAMGLSRTHRGLSDVLARRANVSDCIEYQEALGLDVLTAGLVPNNPLELLSSVAFTDMLVKLRDDYRRIIIDTPPVLPVSDSQVISRYCDSVMLVVKADQTPVQQVRQCIQRLSQVQAPLAGVVLNQLDLDKAQKYSDYGYGGYYESYTGAEETDASGPRLAAATAIGASNAEPRKATG